MQGTYHVTVHTRNSEGSPEDQSLNLDQRRALQALVQPVAKAATCYSCSPWDKNDPIEQSPNTRAYTATASPRLKRLRPPSRSPSPVDWDNLSNFHHWVEDSSPPRPSLNCQPSYGNVAPRVNEADRKPTAGAWASTRGKPDQNSEKKAGKGTKRVRVESPAATLSRSREGHEIQTDQKMTQTETGGGPDASEGSLRRSSRTRRSSAKELVPATPDDGGFAEAPHLALGAIKRCIPEPYHHENRHELSSVKVPERQEPSRVLHSFVDSAFTPYQSASSAASLNIRAGAADYLSTSSPQTYRYLIPGRQGSWLIPVSGPFSQLPQASRPVWFTKAPAPSVSSTSKSTRKALLSRQQQPPLPIHWTSPRLSALWSFLTNLHESSAFGRVRASCHLHLDTTWAAPPARGGKDDALPEYVKITIDANLALAFRTLLSLLSVETASGMTSQQKDQSRLPGKSKVKSKEKGERVSRTSQRTENVAPAETAAISREEDSDKWLKGRALVWVDESGRAILVA